MEWKVLPLEMSIEKAREIESRLRSERIDAVLQTKINLVIHAEPEVIAQIERRLERQYGLTAPPKRGR